MSRTKARTLLVAVGSPHGDDQVAWNVADLLTSYRSAHFDVRKAAVPLDILNWLDGVHELHIADACEGGGSVGDVVRCEWTGSPDGLPSLHGSGTHDFDVLSVLRLAKELGRLPDRTVIWGIVGAKFHPTETMSVKMGSQIPKIAAVIGKEFSDARKITSAFAAETG